MPPFAAPLDMTRFHLDPDGASDRSLPPPAVPVDDLDAQTGDQYNIARYYCPEQGRWASQDPIDFAADEVNQHPYPGNDPSAEHPG